MLDAQAAGVAQFPQAGSTAARRLKAVALYGAAPLLVVLYATANNWKLLEGAGVWVTLGYYTAHAVATFPVTAVLTWAVWRALAPLRPGLVTITVIGSLLGCLTSLLYVDAIVNAVPGASPGHGGMDWLRVANSTLRATAIWVGLNWIFDRFLGLPRYRYPAPAVAPPAGAAPPAPVAAALAAGASEPAAAPVPGFLQRLARPVTVESLLAIRAEQHYIMVISDAGQELVLYRLGDAVRELPPDCGLQVHRSWWVKADAIRAVESGRKKLVLELRNGLKVPVSAPYQALARARIGARARPA